MYRKSPGRFANRPGLFLGTKIKTAEMGKSISVVLGWYIESLRRKSIMEKMIVVFKRQRQKPWAFRSIISADKLHISWPHFPTIGGCAPPLSARGADVVCWLVKAHARLRFCLTNGQIGCTNGQIGCIKFYECQRQRKSILPFATQIITHAYCIGLPICVLPLIAFS